MYNILCKRALSTTPRLGFKFKLTDELVKEYEEKERSKPKEQPVYALHTRESSLIMGRVSSDRFEKVIKVGVPKHRFNEYFLLYVREQDNIQAFDRDGLCKPGDWVLLRKQEVPLDEGVEHEVVRIVYSYGNYVDPITGKRSMGIYFEDDVEKLEKIKLEL